MSYKPTSAHAAKDPPFTLAVDSQGQVVAIKGAERMVLGPLEPSCEEMCRFLTERDYGDRGAADCA